MDAVATHIAILEVMLASAIGEAWRRIAEWLGRLVAGACAEGAR